MSAPARLAPAPAPASISIRAAFRKLGISERALLKLIAMGQIRSVVEPGRSLRVESVSVDEYISGRTANGPAEM